MTGSESTGHYLTTEEVAERFRTSHWTVRSWHMNAKGPVSVKIGKRRLYPIEAVEAFEAELQTTGRPLSA